MSVTDKAGVTVATGRSYNELYDMRHFTYDSVQILQVQRRRLTALYNGSRSLRDFADQLLHFTSVRGNLACLHKLAQLYKQLTRTQRTNVLTSSIPQWRKVMQLCFCHKLTSNFGL